MQDDGSICLPEVENKLTSETGKSQRMKNYRNQIKEAAKASHKRLRQIEFRTQGPDHPILWSSMANTPESYYLKFYIFQVVDEK